MDINQIFKLKELIRMLNSGRTFSSISKELDLPRSTLYDWSRKCQKAHLNYVDLREMTDEEIYQRLFCDRRLPKEVFIPDWEEIIPEAEKSSNSLRGLYQKYKDKAPEGIPILSPSSFYREYKKLRKSVSVETKELCISNSYIPGEISMIDYCGDKFEICEGNGQKTKLDIFVAVLPYSHYMFAYATYRQTRSDWLEAIAAWFSFIDGVTKELWLDNSTSLVLEADNYNPKICSEFKNFCEQYSIVAYPTRPGKPKDKGSCERAVGLVQKHILPSLSSLRITSRQQANNLLLEKIKEFNLRPYSERPNLNRTVRFETEEKHLLRALPLVEYHPNCITFTRKVQKGNLVRYQNKRYPVQYGYVGRKVQVFLDYKHNLASVYVMETGECIGKKIIDNSSPSQTSPTTPEDLPEALKRYAESKEELLARIEKRFGPELRQVGEYVAKLNNSFAKRHLNGLIVLASKFEPETLKQICLQVLKSHVVTFQRFKEISDGFETVVAKKKKIGPATSLSIQPSELRGEKYYQELIKNKRKQTKKEKENSDEN